MSSLFDEVPIGSAIFSREDPPLYRYRLERNLGRAGPVVALLGVNPSKAGAEVTDPTITKDIGFGSRLGWGRLIKGNLFARVSTDVRGLRESLTNPIDPIGPENDIHLRQIMEDADIVVPCWGPTAKVPKGLRNRWRKVARIADELGKPLWCFGVAQDGQPRHTLMLAYATPLIPWVRPS